MSPFASLEKFVTDYGRDFDHRLLIYFAGHGHTLKLNYGAGRLHRPVRRPVTSERSKGLPRFIHRHANDRRHSARSIESNHVLFVFDSCCAGTIFSTTRGRPEAISYDKSYQVRQFITSGRADEEVPDQSLFRQQFVNALRGDGADLIKDGYLTGTELGEFLFDRVSRYSHGKQHPQHGKIHIPNLDKGDFVFVILKPGPSRPTPGSPQH